MPTFADLITPGLTGSDFVPTTAPAHPGVPIDTPVKPDKPQPTLTAPNPDQTGGFSAIPGINALNTDQAITDYQKALSSITPASYYDVAKGLIGDFNEPRPELQNYLPNEGLSKQQGLGLLFGSLLSGYPGSFAEGFEGSRNAALNRQTQGRNAYEAALRDWYGARRGQQQAVGQLTGQMMTDARQSAAEIFRYKAQTAQEALIQQRNEETAYANVTRAAYQANQTALRLFSINTTHEDKVAQQKLQQINIQSEAAYRDALVAARTQQTSAYAQRMGAYISIERERLAIMQQQADTAARNAAARGPAEAGRALASINQIVVQLQFERAALTGDPNNPAYIAKAKMLDDEITKLQETSQKLALSLSASPEQTSPTTPAAPPGPQGTPPPGGTPITGAGGRKGFKYPNGYIWSDGHWYDAQGNPIP